MIKDSHYLYPSVFADGEFASMLTKDLLKVPFAPLNTFLYVYGTM